MVVVGGADPCCAAGPLLEVRVLEALGYYPAVVLTSVVPQEIARVYGIYPVKPSVLREQLTAVRALDIHAVKLSLLLTEQQVSLVEEWLASLSGGVPVVIDPVWCASAGEELVPARVVRYMAERLFRHAWVVTPNTLEAQMLTQQQQVMTRSQMRVAAQLIKQAYGPRAVLISGGHSGEQSCVDILYTDGRLCEFEHERLTYSFRGAGTLLSVVVACRLIALKSIPEAVESAIACTVKVLKEKTVQVGGKWVCFFGERLDCQ